MKTLFMSVLVLFLVSGCAAPNLQGNVYSPGSTDYTVPTVEGRVVSIRPVTVSGTSGVGVPAGAVLGGLAGSNIGEGKGSIAGAVVGAIAGGVAGQAIEGKMSEQNAAEYIVRLDNDRLVTVVEKYDPSIRINDEVYVVMSDQPHLVLKQ
ncbi:MAG TPA: glycine zipper 2TM domain-containing protein [Burkholderiales bacterium]|nr:glycine zipper 2TM domain-containing protein [Burkholderiales bacterium]